MLAEPRSYLRFAPPGYRCFREQYLQEITTYGPIVSATSKATAWSLVRSGCLLYLNRGTFGTRQQCRECLERVQCPECGRGGKVSPSCPRCKGLGTVETPTGGWIAVDGARVPMIKWVALRKNPNSEYWRTPHTIGKTYFCRRCGGRGTFLQSEVFAAFYPTSVVEVVERITDPLAADGTKRVTVEYVDSIWSHNGRHFKPGAYFVMDVKDQAATEKASKLAARFKQRTRQYGGLLVFDEPYRHYPKIFMSLKKWEHPWLDVV